MKAIKTAYADGYIYNPKGIKSILIDYLVRGYIHYYINNIYFIIKNSKIFLK